MAHIRQQLRGKVKLILEAATDRPVFLNRVKAITGSELPCMIVTTSNETIEPQTIHSALIRDIELTVSVYEKAFDDVDDKLDAVCVLIENALSSDTTISVQSKLLQATNIDISDEGDQPIAIATMIYSFQFYDAKDPEKII